ncbi:hypothetical protein [Sphaerisporangium aureirubrum]|uniref:DUF5129 domain-containing protein n=1 Tax=Sphaerisporangium aureirubrum TaxID=1544736 RepID=A0ABW1NTU3_9ACTN
MRRWRGVALSLIIGILLIMGAPAVYQALTDDGSEGDALRALCLSPTWRGRFTEVGLTLGTIPAVKGTDVDLGGKPLTLEKWREHHEAAFERTCKAMRATVPGLPALSGGDSGWAPALQTLLGALAGGLATLGVTAWQSARSQAATQAESLRQAAREFRQEAERYLEQWEDPDGGRPSHHPVLIRRMDLSSRLLQIQRLHPRWKSPERLLRTLGEELSMGDQSWWLSLGKNLGDEAGKLRAKLKRFDEEVGVLSESVQHPLWTRRDKRDVEQGDPLKGAPATAAVTAPGEPPE